MQGDTRTNEAREMRELGAHQILDLNPFPFVPDEQVLIGRKRLDALGEALDEIFGVFCGGLVRDRVDDTEHVLGAMIDLAHEEVLPFLALLAFCDIRNGADDARGPSLTLRAFEISTPMHLHPADLTASPAESELDRVGLRIDWIERRLARRPKRLRIVRMHPLHDLLDRRLVSRNFENFFRARIPRDR